MREKEFLKQEWEIFESLCPKEMAEQVKSEDITLEECKIFIEVFKYLGFSGLAYELLFTKYNELLDSVPVEPKKKILDDDLVYDLENDIYFSRDEIERKSKIRFAEFYEAKELHEIRSYIIRFLDNIKSESLRHVFYSSAKGRL